MRTILAVALVTLTAIASAQTRTPAPVTPDPTGSVTGHVFCADTNQPARFAHVSLEAVRASATPAASPNMPSAPVASASGITSVETGLDGSFTLTKIRPGDYYVIVSKQGYVNPRAMFTPKEISDPSPDMRSIIDHALPRVRVENNQTERAEVRLERGAAVSGTILYDDGTPASELNLQLLRKDSSGRWLPIAGSFTIQTGGRSSTDDRGTFRFASLLPDDYIVQANLTIADTKETSMPGPNGHIMQMNMMTFRFSLPFYGSGVNRLSDAKSFTLRPGQELTGIDMTIPISKLHRLTGRVSPTGSAHIINAATVELFQADDKKAFASSDISRDDGLFHFDFIPDGDYTLRVTNARDVVWEPNPDSKSNSFFDAKEKETVIEHYSEAEQPLIFRGDALGITVPVTPAPATNAPAK